MKTINLIFYFPYNWYQYGSVKVRNKNNKIGKIEYAKETTLKLSDNTEDLTFSINFYREKVDFSSIKDNSYSVVYFDIKNVLGIINPKILKIKTFETFKERNDFCNSLYLNFGERASMKCKNNSNLILGLIISILLILTPFYPSSESIVRKIGSENVNLPFILGIGGLVSYLLIFFNKGIPFSRYKSRIYVTIFGFALSLIYINSKTLIIVVSLLTLALLIRSYYEFKQNDLEGVV